jgi:uncharacterized repeat protein (TIGR01451 family)
MNSYRGSLVPERALWATLLVSFIFLGIAGSSITMTIIEAEQIVTGADVVILKMDSKDPVESAESFEYMIEVSNEGDQDASDVILADMLPEGLVFNQVSTTQGHCSFDRSTNTLTCELGTVASQAVVGEAVLTSEISDVEPTGPCSCPCLLRPLKSQTKYCLPISQW